jgi:hypothetical protein
LLHHFNAFKHCNSAKDSDLNKCRAEFDKIRRNLELRVKELEDEMDTQRNELTAGLSLKTKITQFNLSVLLN